MHKAQCALYETVQSNQCMLVCDNPATYLNFILVLVFSDPCNTTFNIYNTTVTDSLNDFKVNE